MRIIIEMTDQESKSMTIGQGGQAGAEQGSQAQEVQTFNGGPPSEDLLAGIRAAGQGAVGPGNGSAQMDAGEAGAWMPIPVGEQTHH
ncbi:MAG TPA: hypothetical protein VMP67_12165 [Candidatus Limnocylindria bacterium]|nr:hypothetical protein [Candidatus Limnocylindria bacterium]